ncbi:hypothetical protein EWM64_g1154 [Hericium alpestre]|uniref:Homeobox domain-containing protein n=1 Tax=Hericium alpestre TaxID=135208 RepID=A0A4Z0A725_9AGAM|nr:hypothetical protein EWM64_g1154 [Hericium alpestre]
MPPRPRMRMRPTPQQTEELRKYYQKNQHPSKEQREAFAKQIGMRSQSVTNWFQNQRSMARKRQEEDAELSSLPSLPDKPKSEEALQKLYNRTSSPSIDERTALALEVGMDVAKVTNWFRNLRQTARKRAKKPGDDGDTDSVQLNSASVSRGATPSFGSSSSGAMEDNDMDTEVDDADAERMDEEEDESPRRAVHSDAGSDDEYEEAVTPSPEPSPSPPPPSLSPATFTAVPRAHRPRMGVDLAEPVAYPKAHEPISGVKVEDALLLLGFHQHIVH